MSFPPNHFARPLRHRPVRSWRPLQRLWKAFRWLVDRLARPAVIATLVVLCVALVTVWRLLWAYRPDAGWTLLVLGVGYGAGRAHKAQRMRALAVVSEWHDEEIGAIKLADTLADKQTSRPVELFDQDAQPAFQQGGVVQRNPRPIVVSPFEVQQLVTDRTPAGSTGPAWVDCGRCGGRGWFDAVPASGLRWMQCPECEGAGGKWGQP